MSYRFSFDLCKISQSLFKELARFSEKKEIHRKIGKFSTILAKRLKIHRITGLPISDAIQLMEDFIDISLKNISNREEFLKTKRRVLFLPHCSRKFMDSRCKATFDPKLSSYFCNHCSPDCIINKATRIAEKKGYRVYVVPGGSCIPKILEKKNFDGVVGVACTSEIKLAVNSLPKKKGSRIPAQAVPLLKNGCSGTKFNLETLMDCL